MAKGLFKYMDVDVLAFLEQQMMRITEHYQTDFEFDKRMIERCSMSENKEDKTLLWMSRPMGTHCQREREAFIQDTYDHNTWRFYAEQTSDPIVAFAVELTSISDGVIRGNLYELDYATHAALLKAKAIPAYETVKVFEDGFVDCVPTAKSSYGYYLPLIEKHGPIVNFRTISQDDERLDMILAEQKAARMKMKAADFEIAAEKPSLLDQIHAASLVPEVQIASEGNVREMESVR